MQTPRGRAQPRRLAACLASLGGLLSRRDKQIRGDLVKKNIVQFGQFVSIVGAFVLFTASSQAAVGLKSRDCSGSSCSQTPAAPSGFTFEEAKKAFASGRMPEASELIGAWKNIAYVTVSSDFEGSTNFYDPNGQKNTDGSDSFTLKFSQTTDFFGNNELQVEILGMGTQDTNQGPYEAAFQATASQLTFAQHAYSGVDLSPMTYAYECRLLSSSSSKLLCALRMHLNGTTTTDAQAKYDGQIGAYAGFAH